MVLSPYAQKHSRLYMTLIDNAVRSLEDPQEGFYDSILIAGARNAAIPQMKQGYFKVSLDQSVFKSWPHFTGVSLGKLYSHYVGLNKQYLVGSQSFYWKHTSA